MDAPTLRKPGIKDVALRAGVSTTTISCFLNGNTSVCAPETAKRIRAAVDELQYVPRALSYGLTRGSTRIIGVCLHSPLDHELRFGRQFFERIWRGIIQETDATNHSLLHYPLHVRTGSSTEVFMDGRVDGVLFHGDHELARAAEVARAGVPVLLLTKSRGLPSGCGAVYANEQQTVTLAMEHLYSLGHRRIAYLAGPVDGYPQMDIPERTSDPATLRLTAYIGTQKMAGVFDPALVGYANSWQDDQGKVTPIVTRWRS